MTAPSAALGRWDGAQAYRLKRSASRAFVTGHLTQAEFDRIYEAIERRTP